MQLRKLNLTFFILIFLAQFSHFGNAPMGKVNLDKVHPKFSALITQDNSISAFMTGDAKIPDSYKDESGIMRYGVIIQSDDMDAITASGVKLSSVYEKFATAYLTLEEIGSLTRISSLQYIDAPAIVYPKMNVSTPETGASLLHNGFYNNTSYTGSGAIVVIFDSGIDWNHIDFKNPDDTTKSRILAIWDQTETDQTGGRKPPAGKSIGVEYTQADIEDEIDGNPAGFVLEVDSDGHGTHVAGTAAGSGKKFKGIAPQADIIVVKGGNGSFSELNIIEGIDYAETKANALGKPVVVNLSLGGHVGAHDGSRAYEQVIDEFSNKPGQVVVIAAGNEGDSYMHIAGSVSGSASQSFSINLTPGYAPEDGANNDEFIFDLWYDENVSVTAKVTSPNNITHQQGYNTSGTGLDDSDGKISIINRWDGVKHNIYVKVYDATADKPPATGTWKVELLNASGNLNYDGWLARATMNAALSGGDNNKTIAMPGTAEKGITVGAYVTKTTWPAFDGNQYEYDDFDEVGEIADFSSIGPTRDNRIKPDIAAPGKATIATLSGDLNSTGLDPIINPDGLHVRFQGTSMAAPHVAGAVAVLLAVNPNMQADDIRSLLASTAKKDAETGGSANIIWGSGKLDLLKAVVSQVSGNMSSKRTVVNYHAEDVGGWYPFTSTTKLAVLFTAPHNGKLSGAYLNLISSLKDVDPQYVTYPVIEGNGSLNISIHSDNSGIPGNRIGNSVIHPLNLLDAGTDNYINLIDAGVEVIQNQEYHIVLSLSNPFDKIKVVLDGGTVDNTQSNPSLINVAGSWIPLKSYFTSGLPYNLYLKSEVSSIELASGVESSPENIATNYELFQNYPNPFNPSTTIKFNISRTGHIDVKIFDILGREVITLVDGNRNAGTHQIEWNSRNNHGHLVPTGIYFYRLQSAEGVLTRKMLLVK